MPIGIQMETNVSLGQLVQLQDKGFMVEQTPHVGNIAVRTLALIHLGLGTKLVDITVGEKDNLFFPHCCIRDGVAVTIACPKKMTTHNKVEGTNVSLTNFHGQVLQESGLEAMSHSQWLAKRQPMASQTITALTEQSLLSMWIRYVNTDGSILLKTPSTRSQLLDQVHKVTVPSDEAGWVIPNPINILLDLVAGASETNKDTVYMLSGQSMYKYISKDYARMGSMEKLISSLYDKVRETTFPDLPKQLTVKMVPTPVIRNFISPMKLRNQLDDKLRYYARLLKGNARGGRLLAEQKINGPKMKYLRHKRERVFQKLAANVSHISCTSETGTFYTQHDLASNQDSIYIPPKTMDMTFQEMILTTDRMNQLTK